MRLNVCCLVLACVSSLNAAQSDLTQDVSSWNAAFAKCRRLVTRTPNQTELMCDEEHRDGVYWLHRNDQRWSWRRSRLACRTMFGGSPFADLVSIDDYSWWRKINQTLAQIGIDKVATNGVCCQTRTGRTSKTVCQWLSTGVIPEYLINVNVSGNCRVVIGDRKQMKFRHPTEPPDVDPTPKPCRGRNVTIYGRSVRLTDQQANQRNVKCDQIEDLDALELIGWIRLRCEVDGRVTVEEDDCYSRWLDDLQETVSNTTSVNETYSLGQRLESRLSDEDNLNNHKELDKALDIIATLQRRFDEITDFDAESAQVGSLTVDRFFADVIFKSFSSLITTRRAWSSADSPVKSTATAATILRLSQSSALSLGCFQPPSASQTSIEPTNVTTESFSFDVYSTNDSALIEAVEFGIWNRTFYNQIDVPEGVNLTRSKCRSSVAVGGVYFRLHRYLSANLDDSRFELNSDVIAFSVGEDLEKVALPEGEAVEIGLSHHQRLEFGDRINCWFLNLTTGQWHNDGCRLVASASNRSYSVCRCDHLTNFALVLDVSGRETNSGIKSIVTVACCLLSMTGLVVTIYWLVFGHKRHPNFNRFNGQRTFITINLCLCLLMVDFFVVFGVDRTENAVICDIISLALFYLVLSSFFWALMEGYRLYHKVVIEPKVMHSNPLSQCWVYAIGYGSPLALVGGFLAYVWSHGQQSVRNEYFCWISSAKHQSRILFLVVPATLIIVVNLLNLAILLIVTVNSNSRQSGGRRFNKNLLTGFGFRVVLLGLTWLCYALYVHESAVDWSYVFIVVNGSQGFFIFLFQLSFNRRIQKQEKIRARSQRTTRLRGADQTQGLTDEKPKKVDPAVAAIVVVLTVLLLLIVSLIVAMVYEFIIH